MWEAVERTAGQYDEEYLDKVEKLINKLGEAGIYTLVDMHQDVFARSICGEGFPDFYAKEAIKDSVCISEFWDKVFHPLFEKTGLCKSMSDYNLKYDSNDDPIISECQKNMFGLYYATKESFTAFDALFSNKNGLQDKFISYWDHTSARFAKNPYVVGYDPLNEPLAGNPLHNAFLEVPGVADREVLDPLYSKIFDKYIKNDDKAVMWFEPPPQPDTLPIAGGTVAPVGFERPPGAQPGSPNHVLNDHTYCCAMDYEAGVCKDEEPTPAGAESCMKFHRAKLQTRSADAKRLKIPLFISEFGACFNEGPCTQEITQVAEACDEELVGWAYWQFKYYEDLTTSAGTNSEGVYNHDGSLQTFKVKALSRSYMQKTQGVPTKMKFDTQTSDFSFSFVVNTDINAPSVGFFSETFFYENGLNYTLTTSDGTELAQTAYTADFKDSHLTFQVTDSSLNGQTLTLTASKK